MKIPYFLLLLSSLISLNSCKPNKDYKKQAKLAELLCEYYGLDQGMRDPELGATSYQVSHKVDSLNFAHAITFIKKYGYPLMKDYGPYAKLECVQASIFAILMHSPGEIVNNKENFQLLLDQTKGGMNPKVIALVIDKYLWFTKATHPKEKTTGVLCTTDFGKPCLKYRHKSDSIRHVIGLPPLKIEQFKKCD